MSALGQLRPTAIRSRPQSVAFQRGQKLFVCSVPEQPGNIVLLKLSRPCFYCLVGMKMGAANRICGFPLIRQRSGGCWNTSFKVLHRVETGDSLGNVNVAVAHCQTATLAVRAGGMELNCWLQPVHLSFVTKEVKPLFAHWRHTAKQLSGGFDIQSICHITGAIEWVGMV